MPNQQPPALSIEPGTHLAVRAVGSWQVNALAQSGVMKSIQATLRKLPQGRLIAWDLSQIASLDHIGAQLLWNAWGKARPQQLVLADEHADIFNRIERSAPLQLPPADRGHLGARLHRWLHNLAGHAYYFVGLIGQLTIDMGSFLLHPLRGPWKEISANVFHIGYRALGITALVAFLIGVVLSFLSAQQLHTFGADVYLVNILGMSIIRELGPMLAAILVAGRSGSSITAQLGVMRVTEELDAMLVMGMPHGYRLILPRVLALAISMPLLVIWTDAIALAGGMTAAKVELGLSPSYFLQRLPSVVPLLNYWIGLGKGIVFGMLIALVACHFGLRVKPNTESLGQGTTLSVVTAITAVILADAVFAILFKGVGFR
ncbi:MlaE family ABC transporter permease [Noviherbaspirillum autotrophicum]|uniref:ABC transporter permease n=1 Tax=Noviherbaspirillum autotrophicum TaxID=709839 RepID=A0A0C1Y7X0_9BURK|nr:ABC transporter permease [Noviherbaspirillum autotrophicum]KIF82993.1 ABC transporter permease [Noviherbaspirillum autotrophicum]